MKILLVKLSPVESLDSATLRTIAIVKGLILGNNLVDYLTIPPSSCHVVAEQTDFLSKVNIVRTSQNNLRECLLSPHACLLQKMFVIILKKLFRAFSLYDYTYSIANNIDISLLPCKEYDVIISSSDPKTSHIAIAKLIKQGLIYKKWIQYWGDPMASDITGMTIYPKWLIAIFEKKLLNRADKIVYVSPFTLEEQKKRFPHFAERMAFHPVPYIEEKVYAESHNSKLIVGYFGDYLSNVRDIRPLYNAAVQLDDEICLYIIGSTDLKLISTENINILTRRDISEYEMKADLLVCILNKKGTQIPGKLYHYAATNKPILVIIDGERQEEMIRYLESYQRYILCNNDEISIANKIRDIINAPPQTHPSQEFSPGLVAKLLLE